MKDCLKMGLCDDDIEAFIILEQYIAEYAKKNAITCKLVYFSSGKELLTQAEKTKDLDILFLDIEMPEIDGIAAAFQLLKNEISYRIIMLTARTERFKEAFRIGAFRFVTKPIMQQELFEAVDAVRKRMLGNDELRVYRDGRSHTILQKDICYILAESAATMIYTKKYEFRSEVPLKKWEEVLDNRLFFRCHKAYIVNLGAVRTIEKEVVHLTTGEKILVSRRKKNDFEKKYMEFDTKYC